MEPLFANIVGPYYRRDAIGRVVVEDGLARMEPRGQGLHTRALKGASDALTHAHALLSEIGNIKIIGNINFGNISVVQQEYRRDAIGRVVIEDGLARMEPRGAFLHARAIKGARDALARVSGLLSQGGDALGGALSSLQNLMGPQYRRDAIGRVVTEDGLVRIYGHPQLHTVTISSIKAAVANAISNLKALQDGMIDGLPSWPTSSSVGVEREDEYRRDAIGRLVIQDGLARLEARRGGGLHERALKSARDTFVGVHDSLKDAWSRTSTAVGGSVGGLIDQGGGLVAGVSNSAGQLTNRGLSLVGDITNRAKGLVESTLGFASSCKETTSPESAWAARPSVVSWNVRGRLPLSSVGYATHLHSRNSLTLVGAAEVKWTALPSVVSWNVNGKLPRSWRVEYCAPPASDANKASGKSPVFSSSTVKLTVR